MKATTILLALLLPICAFAEDVSAMAVKANDFKARVNFVDSTNKNPPNAFVEIHVLKKITTNQTDLYSITNGSKFDGVGNYQNFITVLAERNNSKKPVKWMREQMKDMNLSDSDVLPVISSSNVPLFPENLNFAFKSPISLTVPIAEGSRKTATYDCNEVLIAQGSVAMQGNIWWMSGSDPTLNGKPPKIECELSPSDSSDAPRYMTAYINSIEKFKNNVVTLSISLHN